jgi:hypothetical protein
MEEEEGVYAVLSPRLESKKQVAYPVRVSRGRSRKGRDRSLG